MIYPSAVSTYIAGMSALVLIPVGILLVLGLLYLLLVNILPPQIEKRANRIKQLPPYIVPAEIKSLHNRLLVADLHADALLWKRDLLQTGRTGHVDIPRMLEGNIAFQVFGVVTKSPLGLNFENNSQNSLDTITLLSLASGWPVRTWGSLFQRALYQANKLERLAARSNGKFMRVLSQNDLNTFLSRRNAGEHMTAGFADLEGTHALEGKLENLDSLFQAGFRMIGLVHFFDTEAAGSAHGREKGGLTDFGKAVVKRTQELHMVLDLAHSSPRTIEDALEISILPVVASHTGVRGTCDNTRNLSDDQIRGIARTGGVVGIAMFKQAICECSVDATALTMRYTADLVGVDYVALGCDFDGVVEAPIDYRGMALLTDALLRQGFNEEEIQKIMGLNFIRVLKATLPE